jgi:hypothetical protein
MLETKECNKSTHGGHEWIKNKNQSVYFCICCSKIAKRIPREKSIFADVKKISIIGN